MTDEFTPGPDSTPEPGPEPTPAPESATPPDIEPGIAPTAAPGTTPDAAPAPDADVTRVFDLAPPVAPESPPQTQTQVAPAGAAAAPAPAPTVPSGSRVVVVLSRGESPTPPPAFVTVPLVMGGSQGEALGKLQGAGLSAQVFNDYHDTLPRGEVMGQLPHPNMSVPTGSEAVLLVSSGPAAAPTAPVMLPNVVGLHEPDAISKLQASGLSPQIVREYSPNVPLGVVIDQLPSATSLAEMPKKKRSLLWLWILLVVLVVAAIGVAGYLWYNRTGTVPNVVGLTQTEATTAIESAGFKVGAVGTTQTISAAEVGKVVTQTPEPNGEVRLNSGIDIVVSGGQKLIEVPNVVGKPQADAEKALKDAGFTSQATQAFSNDVPKGDVISQAPAAGQKVPAETSIGLTISQGVQNVTVPAVNGQSKSQAEGTLKSAGLGSQAAEDPSTTVPKGDVIIQYPAAGTSVAPGTIVGLIVSSGPPSSSMTSVTVPSVVGKSASNAQSAIKSAGLASITIQMNGNSAPANEVVAQLPEANAIVPKGSSVIIFVSTGK